MIKPKDVMFKKVRKILKPTKQEWEYYVRYRNRYPYFGLQDTIHILRSDISQNPAIRFINREKN